MVVLYCSLVRVVFYGGEAFFVQLVSFLLAHYWLRLFFYIIVVCLSLMGWLHRVAEGSYEAIFGCRERLRWWVPKVLFFLTVFFVIALCHLAVGAVMDVDSLSLFYKGVTAGGF